MTTEKQKINLLVVDDSLAYRIIMRDVLKRIDGVKLSTTVANGKLALAYLQEHQQTEPVDLVLMDLEMPEMDGLQALEHLNQHYPEVSVVMISGATRRSAESTIQALKAGALDFIEKPVSDSNIENVKSLTEKLSSIFQHFSSKMRPLSLNPLTKAVKKDVAVKIVEDTATGSNRSLPNYIQILAIVVSTGGPKALTMLLSQLPGNLDIPVVVVQHMPPLFTQSLAESLNRVSALMVKEAEDGEMLKANCVYLAPGGRHMLIEPDIKSPSKGRVKLLETPPVNSCRPSVDVLFESLPALYRHHVLSVVMTGMGNDGQAGVDKLRKAGAYNLSQDEASCVVYGMPRAVIEANLADEVVPLEKLSNRIVQILGNKTR
jgi:two-component system, chemotaxis family, protein-glutamate methylesterase/glutaminase